MTNEPQDAGMPEEEASTPTVKQATSLCSIDTEYTACALEFCPRPPSTADLVACGTYQLVPDDDAAVEEAQDDEEGEARSPKMKRVGRCLLYERKEGDRFEEVQRIDGAAILDLNWSRSSDPALYLADSVGRLHEHRFESASAAGSNPHLDKGKSVAVAEEDVLALSLDISDRRTSNETRPRIAVSLSSGEIAHLPHFEAEEDDWTRWKAHDYEAWTCGFDYWQPDVIWTGGDDCKLKTWDLRVGTSTPTSVNKQFEGGVTSIRSHHLLPNLFAVGSYDSSVRLFDSRNPSRPLLLSQVDVGGGVWRLKWHPSQKGRLLVAGMHGGFKVVDVDFSSDGVRKAEVAVRFDEHESFAYGADWAQRTEEGEEGGEGTLVGSCSFYDHRLHFWRA